MDENGVAGLGFGHADRGPVAAAFAVVGGLEADKARLLARTFVVGRIDVEDAAARVGFRFGPRGHGDALLRLAGHAVRIAERELALIAGGRLEIEDAARKAFGHGVGHALAVAVDSFAADAQQRERGAPRGRARLAEADFDRGIPVGVPLDGHSNPRFSSVGCSTWKRPGRVEFWAWRVQAARRRTGSGAHGE